MQCNIDTTGERTRIAIQGPVDFEQVEAFRQLLEEHILKQETVELDLAGCDFLCSMAVGTVLGFKIESKLGGGSLYVVNAGDTIRQLFEIVRGADAVFRAPESGPSSEQAYTF